MADDFFADIPQTGAGEGNFFSDIPQREQEPERPPEPMPAVPASLAPPMRFVPQGVPRTEPREEPGVLERGLVAGREAIVEPAVQGGEQALRGARRTYEVTEALRQGKPIPEARPEDQPEQQYPPVSVPGIAYGAGRGAGAMVGFAAGTPAGLPGALGGAALGQFITDFGPAIQDNIKAGMSQDDAIVAALKSSGVSAAAAAAMFGLPMRVFVQALGQPTIAGSEQVVQNYLAGRPLTENLGEAIAAGAAGAAMVGATHGVGRLIRGREPGAAPTRDAITGEPIEGVPERTEPTEYPSEEPPAKPPGEPPAEPPAAAPAAEPPAAPPAAPDLFTPQPAAPAPEVTPTGLRIAPRVEPRVEPPVAEPPRAREAPVPEPRAELDFFADIPREEPPAWTTERIPEEGAAPTRPTIAQTRQNLIRERAKYPIGSPEFEFFDREISELTARQTAEAPPPEPPRAREPEPAPAPKPEKRQSLLDFIRERGGISSKDPLVGDARSVLGKVTPLIRKGGKPLDRLLEGAVEAGYIEDPGFRGGGERTSTIADLLDAMDQDNRARAAGNAEGRVWARGEEAPTARVPTEYEAGVEAAATRVRDELARAGIRGEGVDTGALYEAAERLYRGDVRNPLEAYDRAVVDREERDYAQRRGVREGREEVPPAGEPGAGPRVEEAVFTPRAEPSGARPARKLPRQEVPREDLRHLQDVFRSKVFDGVDALDSIPLRTALKELDVRHLAGVPEAMSRFVSNRLARLIGDTPTHFITDAEMARFMGARPGSMEVPGGLWVEATDRAGRRRSMILINADIAADARQGTHAILHEGIHAAAYNALERNPAAKKVLRGLMDELEKRVEVMDREGKTRPAKEGIYGLRNEQEFLSESHSDPKLQEALARIPTPPKVNAMLTGAGRLRTAWDALVETVRRLLGLPSGARSMLETAMRVGEQVMRPEPMPPVRERVEAPMRRPEERTPEQIRQRIRQLEYDRGLARKRGEDVTGENYAAVRNELRNLREQLRQPAEEPGVEGKPQGVMPGMERRTGEMVQRKAEAPLKPKAEQKPMDFGLFGDEAKQGELFGTGRTEVPMAKPVGGPGFAQRQQRARERLSAKIARSYKEMIQPELIGEKGLYADAAMGEFKSANAQQRDQLYRQSLKRERMWDKVPEADKMEFLKQVETGTPVKPEYRRIAQKYRQMLAQAYTEERDWGSKAAYVKDYFPHIWERSRDKAPIEQHFESMGSTWFQKARTFDLIEEGLRAGYKLKSTNPETLIRDRLLAGADMRMKMQLLDRLKDMGLAREVRTVNDPQNYSDWVKINAPNREQFYVHGDVMPLWKNAVEAKGLWANEGLTGDAFRGWMAFKNAWVPIKLALSAFHMIHVGGINLAVHWNRGLHELFADIPRHLARGQPGQAAMDIGRAARSFARGAIGAVPFLPVPEAKMARRAWLKDIGLRGPEEREAVRRMTEGGFSPMMSEQLRIAGEKRLHDALRNWFSIWTPVRVPYEVMRRGIEKLQKPLFEVWIPEVKTGAYLNAVARWERNHPDLAAEPMKRRVAYRAIAKSMDNRFGEMFYGSLFWNRTIKDAGIGSFLSLGWQTGLIREAGGAGIEALTRPAGKLIPRFKPSEARAIARGATDKISYVMMYTLTSLVAGALMTKLFTGKDPQDIWDMIFPRAGGENADGTPRRMTTPFYTREFPMMMKHIQEHGGGFGGTFLGLRDMALNKMMFGPIWEIMQNRNYFGQQIYDPDAPLAQRLGQFGKHIWSQQMSPMSASGAVRAEEAAGIEKPGWIPQTKEGWASYMGFGPAPKYAERTALQNRISLLYREHVAPATRAYEDPELNAAKRAAAAKVMRAIQSGDEDAIIDARNEAIEDAGLPKKYVNEIGRVSGDQKQWRGLTGQAPGAAYHLLESMTDAERERYWPYTANKLKQRFVQEHPDLVP